MKSNLDEYRINDKVQDYKLISTGPGFEGSCEPEFSFISTECVIRLDHNMCE